MCLLLSNQEQTCQQKMFGLTSTLRNQHFQLDLTLRISKLNMVITPQQCATNHAQINTVVQWF